MAEAAGSAPVRVVYRIAFPGGRQHEFTATLDPDTLQLRSAPSASLPEWTRLSHQQCQNCPLQESQHPRCPAAVSLMDVVAAFGDVPSIEQVDVEVLTDERRYAARCSIQVALGSLIGLLMSASGCPVTAKLRPMARFHLPFATLEETRYRTLSAYLLAQYLAAKRGATPDWDLRGLAGLLEDVAIVNRHFAKRLGSVVSEDANLNAVVRLDAVAGAMAFSIDQQYLEELERLFAAYLARP